MRTFWVLMLCGVVVCGCKKSGTPSAGGGQADKSAEAAAQQSADPIELKVKWPVGNRYTQRLTVDSSSETTVAQSPKPIAQKVHMEQEYVLSPVKEREKGGKELELEVLSTEMAVTMGGKVVMSVDTKGEADGSELSNPLIASYRQLIGAKIKYLLDRSNHVEKVEGLKEIVDKATARAPAQAKAMVRNTFNDEYFKQLVDYARVMPDKPVKPGDTWPVKTDIALGPMGQLRADFTYTFKGMELREKRQCALLDFNGTVASKGGTNAGAGSMNIENGTMTGKAWFDPELGTMVDMNVDQDLTIQVTYTLPVRRVGTNAPVAQTPTQQTAKTQAKQKVNVKLVDFSGSAQ